MATRQIPLWTKASDPGINDDITFGMSISDHLKNTVSNEIFVCEDNTNGAAVWSSLTDALAPSGDMLGANNLSDVASATTSRSNLSVESTTQLNARDTANRARANHTGTQLAATISNFASTVRAVVLTGISFASSATITAADSVLSALGKLQAQVTINNAKGTTTEASSSGTTTTTSATPSVISGMTITPGAGDYLVAFSGYGSVDNNNETGKVGLYVNGVLHTGSDRVTDSHTVDENKSFPINAKVTVTAGQAIDVRFDVTGGDTFTMDDRILTVTKVG